MCRVIAQIGTYKILQAGTGYIVVNTSGKYEHHSHVKTEKTARMLIRWASNKTIPRSKSLIEAARRISIDDKYIYELEQKQRKHKQYYFNPQKGVRR